MPPITLLGPEESKPAKSNRFCSFYLDVPQDLFDYILGTFLNLRKMRESEMPSEQEFIKEVSNAYHAMKRFVESETVGRYNFPEIIEMQKAPYRWGTQQLEQIEYPADVDKTIRILEDMLMSFPR